MVFGTNESVTGGGSLLQVHPGEFASGRRTEVHSRPLVGRVAGAGEPVFQGLVGRGAGHWGVGAVDDYVGHLREFRRILRNLESQATHPLNRETIVALTKKLDRDESQLNADRLERSIRATVEATRSIEDLEHYEQDILAVFHEITSRKRRELERERFPQPAGSVRAKRSSSSIPRAGGFST